MLPVVAACLLLGALSLLGPSEPSYDPWAWLVWGREIAHLGLDTTGGPSWKPLPVLFTTAFAPLSKLDNGIPPALWIAVARAGGLLALALAFKVADQLAGGKLTRRLIAGGVAALSLVLMPEWVRYLYHGNEAPLVVALALWALHEQLGGRPRAALVLGALVCLARPELFGFLLLYAAYVWWHRRDGRSLVIAALTLVPAAWVIPAWIGSGDPLSPGMQARSEPSWSLSLAPVPWRAALEAAQGQAWVMLELAALAAVLLTLLARWTRHAEPTHGTSRSPLALPGPDRPGAVVALAGFAVGLVALYVAMTEVGFSGNVRYVLPALVAVCVLGGVGAALLVEAGAEVGRSLGRRHGLGPTLGATAVGIALLLAAAPELRGQIDAVRLEARDSAERARLHRDLERAVDRVGARYVTLFGPATINRSYQTHLAWELSLPLSDVHNAGGRGLAFNAPAEPVAGVIRVYRRARRRTLLATVGKWRVSARPANARHVFTWPIVGFDLRTAAAERRLRRPRATGRTPL